MDLHELSYASQSPSLADCHFSSASQRPSLADCHFSYYIKTIRPGDRMSGISVLLKDIRLIRVSSVETVTVTISS